MSLLLLLDLVYSVITQDLGRSEVGTFEQTLHIRSAKFPPYNTTRRTYIRYVHYNVCNICIAALIRIW